MSPPRMDEDADGVHFQLEGASPGLRTQQDAPDLRQREDLEPEPWPAAEGFWVWHWVPSPEVGARVQALLFCPHAPGRSPEQGEDLQQGTLAVGHLVEGTSAQAAPGLEALDVGEALGRVGESLGEGQHCKMASGRVHPQLMCLRAQQEVQLQPQAQAQVQAPCPGLVAPCLDGAAGHGVSLLPASAAPL